MTSNNQIILIIEDDLNTRELYEEVFKKAGFGVDTVGDGAEGLKKAQQGGYSLVLLDIMVPKVDGLQILSQLQTHPPKTKNGPIIILTNLAYNQVLAEGLKLGAQACLIKTDYNPDQLVNKVKSFLENK